MPKYNLHFTLDYEIHGNGDGNPYNLMVEPTYRLMDLLERYGQRVTIMADIAEILAFERYREKHGSDDYHIEDIREQLREAVRRGHDVQLHVHSSYFCAEWRNGAFDQCIEDYNMAALPIERIDEMVGACVQYLEELLQSIKPDYKVWLFRAANWSMMPTENLYKVLVKYGIKADTSVYKGGVQGGNVCYDYRHAFDNLLSYPASAKDINYYDTKGALIEYPIYCEMKPFWQFLSLLRIFRMVRAKFHKHKENQESRVKNQELGLNKDDNRRLTIQSFFRLSPWKMDFNQATSRQLIAAMKRIMRRNITDRDIVNVVLIGHSKTFVPYNEKTLEPFLKWITKQEDIRKR